MKKPKVLIVFGTRPEAIKMAPLCHQFRSENEVESIICVTAQHREMLDQVLNIFDLKPDIDLNLMRNGQTLFDLTSSILHEVRQVLLEHQPDLVLVHGDTTTAMATSLSAFYAGVPVAHVEAGLRTHNIHAPFPEEYNRRIIGLSAALHFAPTALSRSNLEAEQIEATKIFVTGNTVIDSLHWVLSKLANTPETQSRVDKILAENLPFDWRNNKYVLITGHRRENFGQGFHDICKAINELSKMHPEIQFVYPVHLNPNVQAPVSELLHGLDNVHLIQPLEYEPFVCLLERCFLVLTDSGGIQEEAPSLGKPVLVMRDLTERPEAVDAGTVELVGADKESIVNRVDHLLCDASHYRKMSTAHNPYGNGRACIEIVRLVREYFDEAIQK